MTLHRSVYRAQAKPGLEEAAAAHFKQQGPLLKVGLKAGDLMTLSLFRWGMHFITYYESIQQPVEPAALFGEMADLLESWPGAAQPRTFVPLMDIFHWQEPDRAGSDPVEYWRRKQPIERISGRVARLNPDKVSSYIFYHYQLQEEKPGSVEKYGQISLHENLIFFYQEYPVTVEEPRLPGRLTTTHTPDHWQDVMFPHFMLWENVEPGQEIWQSIELVLHR
jgi:hypothetical protein